MHKVHTVAEFRHFCYQLRGLRTVYTCEHKECACGKKHTVDRTESPSYFYYGSSMKFSGYSLDIERIDGQCSPYDHQDESYGKTFGAIPGKMNTYVMCHYKISQITGEVPQHMIFIPETLPPHFTTPGTTR